MSDQISRDHHFVAQSYLRRWAENRSHVMAYRTLVSKSGIPLWESRSIKGTAYHRDLYTNHRTPEIDDFENWIATEFEEPATEALKRATEDAALREGDHRILGGYFAAQDVRTPRSFLESQKRWAARLPATLQATLDEVAQNIRDRARTDTSPPSRVPPADVNAFGDALRLKFEPVGEQETEIQVHLAAGRALWLFEIRILLTGKAIGHLRSHKWSIVSPAGSEEWITSDHPTLRLFFKSMTDYHFDGGWGRKNCDLILPLSPRHLLYAQIGATHPERLTFSRQQTAVIQRLLAERAHRWVFARQPVRSVQRDRPRVVDASRFKEEAEFWAAWDRLNQDASSG